MSGIRQKITREPRGQREPYPKEQRAPYLHIEVEGTNTLTHEEQTDLLLQISKWVDEAFCILSNNKVKVTTNKVRNQVPGAMWRSMTPEQRQKVLDQIKRRKNHISAPKEGKARS